MIGQDEDAGGDTLRAIEFPRIKGGKPFDIDTDWYAAMLADLGQAQPEKVSVEH